MKKYKSMWVTKIGDGIVGFGNSSERPDGVNIFPRIPMPIEILDIFGNPLYKLVMQNDTTKVERVTVEPTEEQMSAVRKRRIVQDMQKAGYDINTEIALIKDAITAQSKGKPLPNEYAEMENVRQNIKTKVKDDGAIQRSLQTEI